MQFERRGFFRIDKADDARIDLIYIPDGKTKAASIQTALDQEKVVGGKDEVATKNKSKKQEKKK